MTAAPLVLDLRTKAALAEIRDTDRLFRERLRLLRAELSLGRKLDQWMGLHRGTVYNIETGRRRVSIGEATTLASLIGIPLALMIDPAVTDEQLIAAVHKRQSLVTAPNPPAVDHD